MDDIDDYLSRILFITDIFWMPLQLIPTIISYQ